MGMMCSRPDLAAAPKIAGRTRAPPAQARGVARALGLPRLKMRPRLAPRPGRLQRPVSHPLDHVGRERIHGKTGRGAFAIQQLPAPGTGMPAEPAPLSQTPTWQGQKIAPRSAMVRCSAPRASLKCRVPPVPT